MGNKVYNSIEEVSLLLEEDIQVPQLSKLIASTKYASGNRFYNNPQGFIIQDTVNNPLFPIPHPILDDGKGYLGLIFKQYIATYQKQFNNNTFPWHYVIEFDKDQGFYVVHNTRPINLKFPFNREEILEHIKVNDIKIDDKTKELLDLQNKDPGEMINIIVIGDSNFDVYIRDIYNKISEFIISPLCKLYRINPMINEGIYFFNIGNKFKPNVLQSHIKKL